ncbi:MAG: hypothetical protein KDI30_06350, partial [Pseudomonadales bacterium]|nr:hypothetical protein [Pseudomonadales bacterium]
MTEPENNIDTLLKELDQDKIKVWFNALKQQPLPTAIDFFEHFSKRLLEVVEDPAIILKTTETIRPIIYQLDGLSDKLPAEQRTASHLRILNLESAIYEHLLNMAPQVPEAILPQAVHRCLATQIQ